MAERSVRGLVLLWGLALAGVAADQATKYGVFAWLYNGADPQLAYPVFDGAFQLVTQFQTDRDADGNPVVTRQPYVNHGALFGLGRRYVTTANSVFAAISLAAALAIAVWGSRPATTRDLGLCAALGLILAGTLGNLYDRLVFNGVRDFLHWYAWVDWPVFNVADVCLVLGAFLLLAQAFFGHKAAVERPALDMAPCGKEVA